jgi:ribosomal protein S18 acetylase RimI-like enzyme
MIEIKPLNKVPIPTLHKCFNEAFSDYAINFNIGLPEFKKKFIEKLQINMEFSCGAFKDEALVGFIFTAINKYQHKKTAYNGGTGVIPEFRGMQIPVTMYDYLFHKFKNNGVEQVVLEVITTNERAIKAYEKSGLEKNQLFRCYKLQQTEIKEGKVDYSYPISLYFPKTANFKEYQTYWNMEPDFLDQSAHLEKNLHNEKIIEAFVLDNKAGYVIFQPESGRISQFAVKKEFRTKGVGTFLLKAMQEHSILKSITVMNIPDTAKETNIFFVNRGFENQINQFEMVKHF